MAERSLVQRMLRHLKGQRHLYVPSTMTLPPLDPAQVKDERELERRGKERGSRNQPGAQAGTFDEVESEIVTLIEHQREIAWDYTSQELSTYTERLNSLDLDSAATEIEIEARKVLSEFSTELSHGADRVYAARRRVAELDRDLKAFQAKHKRESPAHYPSSLLLHFGVLLGMFLTEAVLNGLFIGETHSFGLIGGFSEAIIIASVNVGLGGFFGYGVLRQCVHRAVWRKLLGIIGLLVYLSVILGFNLAVAHYRDALASGSWDTAQTRALETLIRTPAGVADIKSWLLLMVGVFFSLFAVLDGFWMDDPYPGYGSRWRRLTRAQASYRDIKAHSLEMLSEIKDEAVEAMRAARQELTRERGQYRSMLEGRQRLAAKYMEHLRGLEEAGNNLLTVYRDANRTTRTEPVPKHFETRWSMEMTAAPVFGELDVRKIDAAVQRANDVLIDQIHKVHNEYDKAIRAFQRIEELSAEELKRGSAEAIVEAA